MVRGKVIVILLLASLLISPLGSSPVSAADGGETQGVLPDAVVAELLQNCDPEAIAQVYQEYTQKLTAPAEVSPAPVQVVPHPTPIEETPLEAEVKPQAGIEQLKREIAAIVEQCFTRELGNLTCPDAPCAAAAYLQRAGRLKSDYLDNPALPAPRGELEIQLTLVVKKCLQKLLEDCNCDVACLECLLQAVGPDPAYTDLATQVKDRLAQCPKVEPVEQPTITPPVTPPIPVEKPEAPEESLEPEFEWEWEPEKMVDTGGPGEAARRLEQLLVEAKEKAVQKAEQEGEAERIPDIETDFDRVEELLTGAIQRATEEQIETLETEIVELELRGTSPLGTVELTLPLEEPVDVSALRLISETTDTELAVTVPVAEEREAIIEIVAANVSLSHQGSCASVKLPLLVEGNQLYSAVGDELHAIDLLPGDIVAGLEMEPGEVALQPGAVQLPVYHVSWGEPGRLFGLVPLTLPRQMTIDAASGEVLSLDQPWWGYLVTGIADIVPGTVFQQAPPAEAEEPPCLCEYIKVRATGMKLVPPKKVERKQADVKIVKKKDNVTHTLTLKNVNVEYYEVGVQFPVKLKLKCCKTPKNKVCTANVTLKAPFFQVVPPAGVKIFGKHWVERLVVKSAHFVDKNGKALKKLEFQLENKCGRWSKSKTFEVNYVMRLERRLSQQEFRNEKWQKDATKIKNLTKNFDIAVDFPIEITCEGWKKVEKANLVVVSKPGWEKVETGGSLKEEVTVKEKCLRAEAK